MKRIDFLKSLGLSGASLMAALSSCTSNADSYITALTTPSLTSFTPNNSPVGTSVTISGSNFGTDIANNQVYFNGVEATILSITSTKIVTTVPSGATTGKILLYVGVNQVESTGDFIVAATVSKPSISSFAPASAAVGSTVVISGTNFSTVLANNIVTFNGVSAKVTAATAIQITCSVPSGATSGTLKVSVSTNMAVSSNQFIVSTNTTNATPTISSFSPISAMAGSTVTIIGTNFSITPANNLVMFNNVVATVSSATATSIVCVVPAGTSSGKVSVTVGSLTANSSSNFSALLPTINSFTPTPATIGANVTITGTNFSSVLANNKVTINGVTATVTSSNSTTIVCTIPTGATSGKIIVNVNGNIVTSSSDLTIGTSSSTISNVLLTVDLSSSTYSTLKTIGNYKVINGIVLAYTSGGYVAVKNLCSHENRTNVVWNQGLKEFQCTAHNAYFSSSGTWVGGQRANALTVYKTYLNGTTLQVGT